MNKMEGSNYFKQGEDHLRKLLKIKPGEPLPYGEKKSPERSAKKTLPAFEKRKEQGPARSG